MSTVPGFTRNQRLWFLERDGHQCQFRTPDGGRWVRCPNRKHLQVHHILPRGWAKTHYPEMDVNNQDNGVSLCEDHHVNPNGKLDSLFVLHPDTAKARSAYREGNGSAYRQMEDRRKELCQSGVPYWNTRWDWLLTRIVSSANRKFRKPYPAKGGRK